MHLLTTQAVLLPAPFPLFNHPYETNWHINEI